MSQKLVYDIHDKPKFGKMIIFALQQVLAILAATIAVPNIIGLPAQVPAAIFGAGVGTLIYQLFTKFKSPVFLGSSFAFLNSLFVAVSYGYCGIILGSIVAGMVYVILALIIHFTGSDWVNKLMPPVIIGPTVALIGLSLAVNAMGDMVKVGSSLAPLPDAKAGLAARLAAGLAVNGNYNLAALACGLVAFLTIVICSTQKRYTMGRLIPFIIGIATGYIAAVIVTIIGKAFDINYFHIVNLDPIVNNFVDANGNFVGITAFFDYPRLALFEAVKELKAGSAIDAGAAVEIIVAFLPVALVVFAEHIADHKNLSSIIGRDLIKEPGLKNTLLGDGVGSMAGTVFGICPNTTYGESVGCVAITRNASVVTITTTAFMCMGIAFFKPLMVILQSIPACVMGGVCLTLYGFIAVSGLRMFKNIDLDENKNMFVVAAILIAGIGGLAIQIPYGRTDGIVFDQVITITPIATALIVGIVTNFILGKVEKSKLGKEKDAE